MAGRERPQEELMSRGTVTDILGGALHPPSQRPPDLVWAVIHAGRLLGASDGPPKDASTQNP